MADHDGDSQMLSSASSASSPSTPPITQQPTAHPTSSTLSPPDSQHRSNSNALANANGKRPLNTISNGPEDDDDLVVMSSGPAQAPSQAQSQGQSQANLQLAPEFPTQTHAASGYTWNRKEDEPGYAWANKKAVDEYHRAWDGMVQKDHMVKGEYACDANVGEVVR